MLVGTYELPHAHAFPARVHVAVHVHVHVHEVVRWSPTAAADGLVNVDRPWRK